MPRRPSLIQTFDSLELLSLKQVLLNSIDMECEGTVRYSLVRGPCLVACDLKGLGTVCHTEVY